VAIPCEQFIKPGLLFTFANPMHDIPAMCPVMGFSFILLAIYIFQAQILYRGKSLVLPREQVDVLMAMVLDCAQMSQSMV
jgi:hypothetical protein